MIWNFTIRYQRDKNIKTWAGCFFFQCPFLQNVQLPTKLALHLQIFTLEPSGHKCFFFSMLNFGVKNMSMVCRHPLKTSLCNIYFFVITFSAFHWIIFNSGNSHSSVMPYFSFCQVHFSAGWSQWRPVRSSCPPHHCGHLSWEGAQACQVYHTISWGSVSYHGLPLPTRALQLLVWSEHDIHRVLWRVLLCWEGQEEWRDNNCEYEQASTV